MYIWKRKGERRITECFLCVRQCAKQFTHMISSNRYSCHIMPNAQMVKLRLRDIWYEYISERHMAKNYLSCGCAKGLRLPLSV